MSLEETEGRTATSEDTCLACGNITKKGHRRLFFKSERVFNFWKSILVSEFSIDVKSLAEEHALGSYKFMCSKCHNKYDKLISLYDELKLSLQVVISCVFKSHSSTSVDTAGQKRYLESCGSDSRAKRFKPPIIVHDQPKKHTTTVVSY